MKKRYFKVRMEQLDRDRDYWDTDYCAIDEDKVEAALYDMLNLEYAPGWTVEECKVGEREWANPGEDCLVTEYTSEHMWRLDKWGEAGGPFPD